MEDFEGKSYVNERGEVVRGRNGAEREVGIEEKLYMMYYGMLTQNNHPTTSEQPEDLFYWKGDRLSNIKADIDELERLARENNLTEIVNPWNQNEKVGVSDFVAKVRKSIEYSERVGE